MRTKSSGVYAIQNQRNGKLYIGSSSWIDHRWREHVNHLRNGKHHCHHLQNAWDHYGSEGFKWIVLEEVSPTRAGLVGREQFYLDEARREGWELYNHNLIAGSRLGSKWTPETRKKLMALFTSDEYREKMQRLARAVILGPDHGKKISAAQLGKKRRPFSDEWRRNISAATSSRGDEWRSKLRAAKLGKRLSQDVRSKIATANIGHVPSEETRRRISRALTGKVVTEETRSKLREAWKRRKGVI